jgi:hypothetical protein
MVANKHWHWWDIFHTGGPAGRRTDYSIRSAFFTSTFSTSLFRSRPQPKPFPIRLNHTWYASIPELRRSAATEGFLLGTNLTSSSRDSHGKTG